nr:MAG TPA: hypothetical protein [Caudoviricetes sp.]
MYVKRRKIIMTDNAKLVFSYLRENYGKDITA